MLAAGLICCFSSVATAAVINVVGGYNFTGVNSFDVLELTAGGNVTDDSSASIYVSETFTVYAGSSITLGDSISNITSFGAIHLTAGNSISLAERDAMHVLSARAPQGVSLTAGGNVSISPGGNVMGSRINITSPDGIHNNGVISSGGGLSLDIFINPGPAPWV